MAYVGNIVAFLNHALTLGPGRHVCNYVDTPEFDMNQLVTQVRGKLTGKYDVGPRMPLAVGMAIGHAFDLVAKLTGKTFPISAIRVQKFTSFTQFSSAARSGFGFEPLFTIQEGLDRTLETEFLPTPDRDPRPNHRHSVEHDDLCREIPAEPDRLSAQFRLPGRRHQPSG